MKPAPFDYVRVDTVDDALEALTAEEAKVLAGGQSLVPLLAMRLARPAVLVDVNRLPLTGIDVVDEEVRIGALVRHADLAATTASPLLAEAASLIGHPAIRNRGTIGGSLAHADPVAELPCALLALGGSVVVASRAGTRTIAADELFEGFLTTTLAPDELLVEVRAPVRDRVGFAEWAPRCGDFAVVGVAVVVEPDGAVRAAACGIANRPVDISDAFADRDERAVRAAVTRACAGDDDKAELAGLLAVRALSDAGVGP